MVKRCADNDELAPADKRLIMVPPLHSPTTGLSLMGGSALITDELQDREKRKTTSRIIISPAEPMVTECRRILSFLTGSGQHSLPAGSKWRLN